MISPNDDILFFDDMILSSNCGEIMMSWEKPIMYKMADEICKNKGWILEVGFGMGISADRIQMNNPEKHVIVEINKQIFKKAEEWSIDKKNVILIEGDIVDLKFDLKQSKDKEIIYKDILFNIETSLNDLIKRDQENERFNLGETIDYKESIINLKKSLDEYKRVYKLRF